MQNKKTQGMAIIIAGFCLLFSIIASIGLMTEQPKNSAYAVDYSIPTSDPLTKNYKSNIPLSWYLGSYYGVKVNDNSREIQSGIDFVSLDGQKNYANDSFQTLKVGETLEFYLEFGMENYDASFFNNGIDYLIKSYADEFSLEVTQEYEGITYTLLNTENPTQVIPHSTSYDPMDTSKNPNNEMNNEVFVDGIAQANVYATIPGGMSGDTPSYDYAHIERNASYRLMKFKITAKQVGASFISVDCGYGNFSYKQNHKLVINVVDENNDGEITPGNVILNTNETMNDHVYNVDNYVGNASDSNNYVPLTTRRNFWISSGDVASNIKTAQHDYSSYFHYETVNLIALSSDDKNVTVSQVDISNYLISFLKSGKHQLNATVEISITNNSSNRSNSESYTFTKDVTLNFVAIDNDSVLPSSKFTDENNHPQFFTGNAFSLVPEYLLNNSLVTYTAKIDSLEVASISDVTYDTAGTHTLELTANFSTTSAFAERIKTAYINYNAQVDTDKQNETTPFADQDAYDAYLAERKNYYESNGDFMAQMIAINNTFTTQSTFSVADVSEYFPTPELKFADQTIENEISIDLKDYTSATIEVSIANISSIASKGEPTIYHSFNSPSAQIVDGLIKFDTPQAGIYDYTLSFNYGSLESDENASNPYSTSKSFRLIVKDSSQNYTLSSDTARIVKGEKNTVNIFKNGNYTEEKLKLSFFGGEEICSISQNTSSSFEITASNIGSDYIFVSIEYNGINIASRKLYLIVTEEKAPEDINAGFVQGNNISLLLSENNSTELELNYSISESEDAYVNWFCFNNSIVEIQQISQTHALLVPKRCGTTTIVAICQLFDGTSINAVATINVLDSEPTLSIEFSKQDDSAYNIYDLISTTLNTNGFIFSGKEKIDWYIDNEKITNCLDASGNNATLTKADYSFFNKYSDGIHTVKAQIVDEQYNFDITAEAQINVSQISDQEQTLSFSDSEIYLLYTASKNDIFNTQVLLNGIVDESIAYNWSVDNNKIVSIMTNKSSVLIEPKSVGETKIVAFCEVGKFNKTIIRAELSIIVEKPENLVLKVHETYPKPGNDLNIDVLINGRNDFKNFNPTLKLTKNGEDVQFVFDNSIMTLSSSDAGTYNIEADFGELTSSVNVSVTSFNMKEFILTILPYLIVACIIALIVYFVLKSRSDPFKIVSTRMKKLEKLCNDAITSLEADASEKNAKKQYRKLTHSVSLLAEKLAFFYNAGYDDFHSSINSAMQLRNIFKALNATEIKLKTKPAKILETIKNNNVIKLSSVINEVIESQNKYRKNIQAMNAKDAKEALEKKKNGKREKINQKEFLINQGIFDDDDDDNN